MKQLKYCPSTLKEGFDTYSSEACRKLFGGKQVSHILDFDSPNNDNADTTDYASHIGRISLSGVQPKGALVLKNGILRKPDDGERGQYILKPAPVSYALLERKYCPANEHLTMQMASQAYGIETAANAVCFFRDGEAAYITKRFDVAPDGTKYQQEDFASLAGLTKANGGSDYKYSVLSYEDCADIIRRYVRAAQIDLLRFFRVVLFNYITLNDDAHLKNFSLIDRGDGDYRLTPAYDLINTSLHLHEPRIFALEKGLFKEGMKMTDTHTVDRGDFEEFGRRIGLPEKTVVREIDSFAKESPIALELIEHSFLSEKLKEAYRQSYQYRCFTLAVLR
ncbi:MAG: HipA domain-containing protein [Bacteroidales bacterium]|nr:HipA domain-containing protein [Bacteroidales bacterium]